MKQHLRLLTLLAIFASVEAVACTCAPGETKQPLEKAELAFVGRPVNIEVVQAAPPAKSPWQKLSDSISQLFGYEPEQAVPAFPEFLGTVRVTFEVSQYIKGSGPKRYQIMTGYGDSDCGLPVSISKKYTIYARRINGKLRTSYCFGSSEYARPSKAAVCSSS